MKTWRGWSEKSWSRPNGKIGRTGKRSSREVHRRLWELMAWWLDGLAVTRGVISVRGEDRAVLVDRLGVNAGTFKHVVGGGIHPPLSYVTGWMRVLRMTDEERRVHLKMVALCEIDNLDVIGEYLRLDQPLAKLLADLDLKAPRFEDRREVRKRRNLGRPKPRRPR